MLQNIRLSSDVTNPQPLGPEVMSGLIVYPLAQARGLIKRYRDTAAASPDELTCWFVMRAAPPLPVLAEGGELAGILDKDVNEAVLNGSERV